MSFEKRVIEHPNIHIASLTRSQHLPYIVFVHGRPGLNCHVLEYLIEREGIFNTLAFNLILYDQRGCGRSKAAKKTVLHTDNIHDLADVCRTITEEANYKIAAIAGHSYGAKLVADYLQHSQTTIPGIFISTALSILTPRITNLLLDLCYLKTKDKNEYHAILQAFEDFTIEKMWALTEKLANVF